MNEKMTDTIRIRAGATLKSKAAKLADKLSAKLPPGSRRLTLADITRMALAEYVDERATK